MGKPHRIFLIGPMGAGKSSVGRELAKTLGMEFRDSDREIEERTGASIPLIFDIEGEAGFRKRETEMIDELTQIENLVLATGGGVVLAEENRKRLATRGTVVYLSATVKQLYERTRRDRNRPLLQTEDPYQRLEELMKERDPLYRQIADLVVRTESRGVHHVVKEIVRRLREATPSSAQ